MKDVIIGVFCLAFSALVYGLTTTFPQPQKIYNNPASYPRALIFLLLILGVTLAIAGIRQIKTAGLIRGNPNINLRKPLMICVLLAGYLILLHILGFSAATFIFLILVYQLLGGSLKEGIVFSGLLTLGEYIVFGMLLKVPLPQSLFW